MTDRQIQDFMNSMDLVMEEVSEKELELGHWDDPVALEKLALVHSSISSVVEGTAMGLGHKYVERALAEAVIRLMDFAYFYNYDLPAAIDVRRKELLA